MYFSLFFITDASIRLLPSLKVHYFNVRSPLLQIKTILGRLTKQILLNWEKLLPPTLLRSRLRSNVRMLVLYYQLLFSLFRF